MMRRPTLIVDGDVPLEALAPLRAPVATLEAVSSGQRVEGKVIVISAQDAHRKARELVASGLSQADVKFVDLAPYGAPLAQIVHQDVERLRAALNNPLGVLSDRVRLLNQWPAPPTWQPFDINDECLREYIRWRPRNLAFCVGDYASGKSTFAQLLALKLLTGDALWSSQARMSVCAWEDDLEDYKDRIRSFSGDHANEVEGRIYWFEPDNDPERRLDEYIDNIEYLTLHEGVRVHVADPWNSFHHETGSDNETKYIEKVLLHLQQLTRKLDITIIVVVHLPKINATTPLKSFRIGNAAGSKQFANKADMGFCISRTTLLSHMLYGRPSEEMLSDVRIDPSELQVIKDLSVFRGEETPAEHMIVVTDKVKIEGMSKPRHMGLSGVVKAFVVDKHRGDIVEDPAASVLAKQLW